MGHFIIVFNKVNLVCPAVPQISPKRIRLSLTGPVEDGANGAAEPFTIIGYCPAVENVWDSVRLSFVPCPGVPGKKFGDADGAHYIPRS